jgi:hypothetical protein
MLIKKLVTYRFYDIRNWEFGIEVFVPKGIDKGMSPSLSFYVGPLELEIMTEKDNREEA